MSTLKQLKQKWMADPEFAAAHEELKPEFEIAGALIKARVEAGLTQEDVAKRMGTTQSVIARLESGRIFPSLKTIYRYAQATDSKPEIRLVHV